MQQKRTTSEFISELQPGRFGFLSSVRPNTHMFFNNPQNIINNSWEYQRKVLLLHAIVLLLHLIWEQQSLEDQPHSG